VGTYAVDTETHKGVLSLTLSGLMSEADMQRFVAEHNAAVDSYRGRPYRVFCDIRELHPLSPECAALFEQAKAHSASRFNFQGSAVLAVSSVVAMQHRRTSAASGVLTTEFFSDDEAKCWAHLRQVRRSVP
jgi:hypothetical protein